MSLSMSAQPGIINTRPANNPEGKMLTMEETILSQKLAPANLRCRWTDNGHIAMLRDGKWVNYDIQTGDTVKFIPQAQYPHAYNKGQNLYLRVQGTDGQTEDIIIAASEDKNISYGTAVSRHEFGINGGIFPSPDKSRIAFYRKDESKVTSFPLLDITTRTGSLKEIKYPMAGMESEIIDLGIYDIASGSILYVTVDDFTPERYLTNITWSPDNSKIFIQVLDRSQKHMKLNMYDAATGEFIKTILTVVAIQRSSIDVQDFLAIVITADWLSMSPISEGRPPQRIFQNVWHWHRTRYSAWEPSQYLYDEACEPRLSWKSLFHVMNRNALSRHRA